MLHAVLIGVDAPRDLKIPPLECARVDAEELGAVLCDRADPDRQVTVLLDERATKARITRVITDELPRRVQPDDAVLLYFAGHGSPELEGHGLEPSIHLVAYDTEHERLHATSINLLSELAAWTRRLHVRVVAMVLDTSFNGMAGGRTFEGPGLRSAPRTHALERISPRRAAIGSHFALLTACGEKEVAREDLGSRHGVFTNHLLAALRRPDLEAQPLTLSMIHRAVCDELHKTANELQHPALHGGAVHAPLLSLQPTTASGAS
jgi:uncharacterized caspase-like protein